MPIEVKYHLPDESLKWLVVQFEILQSDETTRVNDIFVPRPDASLVFHFGLPPKIISPFEERMPAVFITPLTCKPVRIELSNKLSTFIVTCKPAVLSRLLKVNMLPVETIHIPVENPGILRLYEKLKPLATTAERIELFSGFIREIHPEPYCPDEIDRVFDSIVSKSLTEPLNGVLNSTSLNPRSLRRNFIKRVGLPPKSVERIVRLNYLWDNLRSWERIDFQEMILEGGYYDQAHFIKDFKSVTGEVPHHFFKRNLETVKILSGKNNEA